MPGDIKCSIEPLADGVNFLSDAFFVKVANDEEEKGLFVKVIYSSLGAVILQDYFPGAT